MWSLALKDGRSGTGIVWASEAKAAGVMPATADVAAIFFRKSRRELLNGAMIRTAA
jgi:hypothetical protein